MIIDLTGKKVLVTGSSRGIGRALAIALGRAGAQVAVHFSRNRKAAQETAEEAGNNSRTFAADLSCPPACYRLFSEVCEAFGGVDVLVNNAGVAIEVPLEMPAEKRDQIWEKTMRVNLQAPEILSYEAVKHFKESGKKGRLIHLSSRAAFRGDTAEFSAYAASKAGVLALSRTLARAYGKDGIVSFALAPGFVETDMAADFVRKYGRDYILNDLSLNDLTQAEHLAPMVLLLASGLADHATGTTIDLNAGSYVH